ncbi:carbohydrate kinase family protein [Patescibacteria group bacterium]|nr:carbohydrate kinase family protein [Patescibacteria group bacterium]
MDILTIGDSCIDVTMHISTANEVKTEGSDTPQICFIHGSKIPVDQFYSSVGGNSVNVAIGCNLMGLKAGVYTEIGNDQNGNKIIEALSKVGIETKYCIKNENADTNVNSIVVHNYERTIFSYHAPVEYEIRDWEKPSFLYYTSIGDGFEKFQNDLIKYLKENKDVAAVFNPGTYQMKAGFNSIKEFLEITTILIINTEEAVRLVGEKPLVKTHIDLQKLGPKLTVITDGKNGASAFDGEELVKVSAYTDGREVKDKTGAGDAFSSGFISAIFHKKTLKEALGWGSVNAFGEITKESTGTGIYTKEQIEEIINKMM